MPTCALEPTTVLTSPIRPTGDRVIVLRCEPRNKIGSIIIAEIAKEKPSIGIVVASGPFVKDPDLKQNHLVLFGKYSGVDQEVDGKRYLILREEEIMGVVVSKSLADTVQAE